MKIITIYNNEMIIIIITMKKGKSVKSDGRELPDGKVIKDMEQNEGSRQFQGESDEGYIFKRVQKKTNTGTDGKNKIISNKCRRRY